MLVELKIDGILVSMTFQGHLCIKGRLDLNFGVHYDFDVNDMLHEL